MASRWVKVGVWVAIVAVVCAAASPAVRARVRKLVRPKMDVAARIESFGPGARERVRSACERAGVKYPPARVVLAAFKSERVMQVCAANVGGEWRCIAEHPILGASGELGPKLRAGDRQVPEGIYEVESLNPNSMYHVALRVGYPSADDRARGAEDGRTALGGDIMIHGGSGSVGCLAMGDAVAEEVFVLAADAGIERVEVVISPVDWRREGASVETSGMPGWVPVRYRMLRERVEALPRCGFSDR